MIEIVRCARAMFIFCKSLCLINTLSFTKACSVPAFDNLSELKLVLHNCYDWELLTELLKRSPNLEYLVLEHNEVRFISPCAA